jgi:hypothetical protein
MSWVNALTTHGWIELVGIIVLSAAGVMFHEAVKDLYISGKSLFARVLRFVVPKLRLPSKQRSAVQSPNTANSVETNSEDDQIVSPEDFLTRLGVSKNLKAIIDRTAEEFEKHGYWATLATLTHDAVQRDAVNEVDEVFRMPRVLGAVQNDDRVELTGLGLMLADTAPSTSQTMVRLAKICAKRKFSLQDEATISTEILTAEYDFSDDEARRSHVVMRKILGMVGGSSGSDDHWNAQIHHDALRYHKVQDAQGLLKVFARQVSSSIPPR